METREQGTMEQGFSGTGPTSDLDEGRIVSAGSNSAGGSAGARIVGDEGQHDDGYGPMLMTADSLQGDDVVNSAGEDLGHIEAIMLDVESGRIAYAVLSFGGFLGMGNKLFAIPWHALRLDPDNKRFILPVNRERLKNAPGFDKDHWPSMGNMEWASGIHGYYASRPYWR